MMMPVPAHTVGTSQLYPLSLNRTYMIYPTTLALCCKKHCNHSAGIVRDLGLKVNQMSIHLSTVSFPISCTKLSDCLFNFALSFPFLYFSLCSGKKGFLFYFHFNARKVNSI